MAEFKLSFLPLFEDDMLEAVTYISEVLNNPIAAERVVGETEKALYKRLESPLSFSPYKSIKQREDAYYRIFVGNFTVFYVVKGDIMEVRRFIYSRRNIENII